MSSESDPARGGVALRDRLVSCAKRVDSGPDGPACRRRLTPPPPPPPPGTGGPPPPPAGINRGKRGVRRSGNTVGKSAKGTGGSPRTRTGRGKREEEEEKQGPKKNEKRTGRPPTRRAQAKEARGARSTRTASATTGTRTPTGRTSRRPDSRPKTARWSRRAISSTARSYDPPFDPHEDPQLVWAGKAEHTSFDVDTVSLHIHERVSTAAILRAVRREEVQRTLFSDPQFSLDQELAFYQHEMDWANRLILGDSLLVMNSLLRREGMAGKVQCIYIDPPYGVNYNSNFQPRTDQRDVKDGDDRSLTREPEQIRAYRDTWQLGIHSYLTYLRDRLLLARELLRRLGLGVRANQRRERASRSRADGRGVRGREHLATMIVRKTRAWSAQGSRTLRVRRRLHALVRARTASLRSTDSSIDERAARVGGTSTTRSSCRMAQTAADAAEETRPLACRTGRARYRLDNLTSQSYPEEHHVPVRVRRPSRSTPGKTGTGRPRTGWAWSPRGGQRIVSRLATPCVCPLSWTTSRSPLKNVWTDTVEGFTERALRRPDQHQGHRSLRPHDHRPGRSRARPDLRLRHHRLRRRAMGPPLDHLRHQPGRARARAPAPDDRQL